MTEQVASNSKVKWARLQGNSWYIRSCVAPSIANEQRRSGVLHAPRVRVTLSPAQQLAFGDETSHSRLFLTGLSYILQTWPDDPSTPYSGRTRSRNSKTEIAAHHRDGTGLASSG